MLECLQASKVKDEDDADMAHQVAAHLMRALSEYKQLTGRKLFIIVVNFVNCNYLAIFIMNDIISI